MEGFELGTDGPTSIVVGVDGSPTSLRAAAYATGLARRQHARLVAVYVRPLVPTLAGLSMDTAGAAAAYRAQDDVEAGLRATVEGLSTVPALFVVRTGDPFGQLCALATEIAADALVVGASVGRGHRIVGSLATRLIRTGRWPVTVVP
jgi:nucleotide-binding universal stress UspA family protein